MELWAATCLWVGSLCQSHLPTASSTASLRPPSTRTCTHSHLHLHLQSQCLLVLIHSYSESFLLFQILVPVPCRPLVHATTTRPIPSPSLCPFTPVASRPIFCPAPNLPCHSTYLVSDKPFCTDRSPLPLPCTSIASLEQENTASINTSLLSTTTMPAYSP